MVRQHPGHSAAPSVPAGPSGPDPLRLSRDLRRPQFPRPGQNLVFDIGRRGRVHRRIHPLPAIPYLAEDRNPHAIGAQLPPQNIGGRLEPLAIRGRRRVPIGDDHPAIRIGGGQRHEAERVQRAAPQIGIHAQRHPGFLLLVGFIRADHDARIARQRAAGRVAGIGDRLDRLVAAAAAAEQRQKGEGAEQADAGMPGAVKAGRARLHGHQGSGAGISAAFGVL
jgi:hypothetical protein